jgi:hypothetical protein
VDAGTVLAGVPITPRNQRQKRSRGWGRGLHLMAALHPSCAYCGGDNAPGRGRSRGEALRAPALPLVRPSLADALLCFTLDSTYPNGTNRP